MKGVDHAFLIVLGVLLVIASNRGCCRAEARVHRVNRELTVPEIAAVIRCQVNRPEPRAEEYAAALVAGLQAHDWPAGVQWWRLVPLALATVYQQSKWTPDAISKWNLDGEGARIRVHPTKGWDRPDYDLDYGLAQLHWQWAWLFVTTVDDLRDPETNLWLFAWWLSQRARKCVEHYELKRCPGGAVVGDRDCGRRRKCKLTRATFGAPGFAGTTDNLVWKYAKSTWWCIDAAVAGGSNP